MKKKTILWADDDPDDMMIMREVLGKTSHNYNIIEVQDGQKALDYLQKLKGTSEFPCLIILDMNMPILDGRETLSIIKSNKDFDEIPVVMFTTSNSVLDKTFCKKYGVEMITKPPEFKSFQIIVQKLLSFCDS